MKLTFDQLLVNEWTGLVLTWLTVFGSVGFKGGSMIIRFDNNQVI